jgi:5-methyltetrahydrofolate--homocysteine methyltransferase
MVQLVQETVEVPLCIDSADDAALEAALEACEGKALVNSTTGERERMERTLPVVARHGAAVIGMANDDSGISMDPKVRLEAARKIVDRAGELGVPPEDVVIDPLAMTVGADPSAARVFLETAALIRDELGVNMTCGASNISFGLPGRHTIAAAFLPMAMQAGLTCAIANPLQADGRRAVLAADVLLGRDVYATAWIAAFRAEQSAAEA